MPRRSNTIRTRTVWAVVGDGYCEQIYFSQLKQVDRIRNIDVRPELPSGSGSGGGHMKALKKAIELNKLYDKVFCLIDMDTVINDNRMEHYKVEKARAEKLGIVVLEMNPCFEIWFLLHFEKIGRLFTNCSEVVDRLKNKIPEYKKEIKWQQQSKLYANLKGRMTTHAIPYAEFLEADRDGKDHRYPRAEVFRLMEQLGLSNK